MRLDSRRVVKVDLFLVSRRKIMRSIQYTTAIATVSLIALVVAEVFSLTEASAQSGPPTTTTEQDMACILFNSECGTSSCVAATGRCTIWNGCMPAPIGCAFPTITSPYVTQAQIITPVSQCVDTVGSRCVSQNNAAPLMCRMTYWSLDPFFCATTNGCPPTATMATPCSSTLTP